MREKYTQEQQGLVKQYMEDIVVNGNHIKRIIDNNTNHFIDPDLKAAVERYFEIIGEAARRVPESYKTKYNYLPWRQIIGLRNIIAHKYDQIDQKELMLTAKYTLPNLVSSVKTIIAEEFED